ncbi:MAG: hypothetical protein IJH07_01345, partial [Ruminococcus sp.]|nr:hypothetical protein [Ruminococcus sp.]
FLLLSRRAHLLTTHKMGGGTAKAAVRSPRVAAPLEPCGSCRRAVTFRAVALFGNRIVNAVLQP